MKDKYFLISVDTEGDNQWDPSKEVSTQNVEYIPRFQELCEKYGYKPVWLSNYEMVCDDKYVDYMKPKQDKGLCEIGMHLHAWFTPPEYPLEKKTDQRDYLIEYPYEVMEQKIITMTDLIEEKFGTKPVSHRSGRWAMDDRYFKLLKQYGYKIDCSVTPHVSWEKNLGSTGLGGTNYSEYNEKPYVTEYGLLEIPVTIRHIRYLDANRMTGFLDSLREIKRWILGRDQWLRFFETGSYLGIRKMLEKNKNEEVLLFMIHSAELMPGGSPYFKDSNDIEALYKGIEDMFKFVQKMNYKGITMKDFYKIEMEQKSEK